MTSEVQIERIEHFIGSSDGTSQLRVLLWIPYLPENELKGHRPDRAWHGRAHRSLR